jgi:hydrogenase expression/formation protein HypE
MAGKVTGDDLEALVFSRTGAPDDAVLVGPGYGEDAAALQVGEQILVASSDPITFAADRIGDLAVTVATNDVAACGATPRWIMPTLFVPDDDRESLKRIVTQLDDAARDVGVAIVGGHTEFAERDRPLVSTACLGLADRYISTGGAEPGDEIVLTKSAGIEGGAILATDFDALLAEKVSKKTIDAASAGLSETSVVPDAAVLRERATAMHDPTEGGVAAGLLEVARASGVRLEVDRTAVPIREETTALCDAAGVDPLRIFGSGALLATVPDAEVEECLAALEDAGLEAAVIGTVRGLDGGEPELFLDGESITEPIEDDLYPLWAQADSGE